ncbi:MAG: hypothetical protein HZA28_04630 [Candidatus Omnitrophica bacterium]|nr:hypothetical protein [Candidatus Omnitrophota bacterium]
MKETRLFNFCFLLSALILFSVSATFAQEHPAAEPSSSQELVRQAWEASGQGNFDRVEAIVGQCVALYGKEAKEQQKQLSSLPPRGQEPNYQALNDVATCLFIRAEALMNAGKTEDAVVKFHEITDEYSWAQAWDPRGWYWSVAEKSQASIDVLTGKAQEEEPQPPKAARTRPFIYTPGRAPVVDYQKYGEFQNVGTEDYNYAIKDMTGLSRAVGEGIYPNTSAIFQNPRYKEVRKEGRLKGTHWDFVNSDDLEAAYFKWVTAPESWGVRLFYLGIIFEKAGMYYEALRAYHALVIHFPKTVAWTYWQTPWYPGQAAIAKIRYILRIHPELNLVDKYMKITVRNGSDNDAANDVIAVYPGKIVEKSLVQKDMERLGIEDKVNLGQPRRVTGTGQVQLAQYDNGHWQLLVQGKPYIIKGITYAPTKVGQSPDKGTLANWMEEDTNGNGRVDGPYDSWVDKNRNNAQDPDEPVVGDFALMKEMGANTIRLYWHPKKPDKDLLRKMFQKYGFRVIMGNYLGKYAIDSGATWAEGTDYENPQHRAKMMESVQKMVMEFKDEPYILLWVLGNENNYGVACNADKKPQAYFEFVNEVAKWIKSVDPDHPIAVNNGDALFLDVFARHAPDVDIFAGNVYRGDYGFGSFWEQVFDASGKPAFITEYGCPAWAPHLTLEEAEEAQAAYHRGNWMDIEGNLAGHSRGTGNALGGIVFEWTDEWWKNYEPYRHDRKSDAIGPFPGGYYFEEWFGVTGQGNGQHSPFLRQLRKSYFAYKEMWNK